MIKHADKNEEKQINQVCVKNHFAALSGDLETELLEGKSLVIEKGGKMSLKSSSEHLGSFPISSARGGVRRVELKSVCGHGKK